MQLTSFTSKEQQTAFCSEELLELLEEELLLEPQQGQLGMTIVSPGFGISNILWLGRRSQSIRLSHN